MRLLKSHTPHQPCRSQRPLRIVITVNNKYMMSELMRLLVLNPNSSANMTHGMERAIHSMGLPKTLQIDFYTAPSDSDSPASINNQEDIEASTAAVWAHVQDSNTIENYDGVLVACYSSHPLVQKIASAFPQVALTGIFEASVVATLPLLRPSSSGRRGGWGIVTTGSFWEAHLHSAVQTFLGESSGSANKTFRGVFTTGLNAGDFHGGVAAETVNQKLKDATKALLATRNVDCVIMGCAGMAGLEDIIRGTAVEAYGEDRAGNVYVVDGVRAGVGVLEQMVRNRRMFLPN